MNDAGKPTVGPWVRNNYGSICSDANGHDTILVADIAIPCGSHDLRREAEANAELLFEAGNAYHETGLTPRQLLEQRDELLAAAKLVFPYILTMKQAGHEYTETLSIAIAKCEEPK